MQKKIIIVTIITNEILGKHNNTVVLDYRRVIE